MNEPLQWGAESLWQQLEPLLPGLSVEVVARSASTNTALLERARVRVEPATDELVQVRKSIESAAFGRRAADVQPCLLVAEHQTQGRGRLGRLWTSSPGASLTFSLSVPITRPDWSGLSLAVGVALAEALDPGDAASVDAPPPIGRKLGGILIESVTVGASRLAVIGVGINVLPLDTAPLTHGYASVQELDADATPPSVLARVAAPLVQAVIDFNTSGFDGFLQRFAARDLLNGRAITTTQADLPLGTARGVDPDGALRVEAPDGAVQRLVGGEVSVRLQGNEPSEDEDSKAQDTGEDTPC
jgi:BirA family transcriptional regulator, biotin operon repressor / biotin---[acetyl-CoA-carboxylase] ligase